jgi:hypothetical protein
MEPQFCSPWLWGSHTPSSVKAPNQITKKSKKERRRTPHLVVIGGAAV